MTQTTEYIAQINTRNYNDQCKYIYIKKVIICYLMRY